MVFSRSSWRFLAVLAALCVLPLGLGCGGGKTNPVTPAPTSVTVSGTVTYTRKPLLFNPDGTPSGLETDTAKFTTLPLRGVYVRFYQSKAETDASGNPVTVWKVVSAVSTDVDGKYTSSVPIDEPTFVEIASSSSLGSGLRLVAGAVSDPTQVMDRPYYFLRKNAGGATPDGDPAPGGIALSADATVDFAIGVATPWWKAPLANTIKKTTATVGGAITWEPNAVLETVGTGSRVAAILDSAYTYATTIGEPTPGYSLYLHYDGASTDAQSSFIEYDRDEEDQRYFDGGGRAYFGFIRSLAANDDAWDEGVLFPLYARNWLFGKRFTSLLPTTPLADRSDLQDLRPNMALLEGFSQGIAAVLLKSPYLADTSAGPVSYRDIRLANGLGTDAYSAANIAALTWKLNLHANGTLVGTTVTPVADTATGWATLTRLPLSRFFTVTLPVDTTTNYPTDTASIYGQIARLKEAKSTSDTVDLAAFFPDATLTSLLTPFGIKWPRPLVTDTPLDPDAGFLVDWGSNPNSLATALPSFTLSMARAHRNFLNQYPNFSKGEVLAARFTLSGDRIYNLSVVTPGGIPAGAEVQVSIGGLKYLFAAGTAPIRLPSLSGNNTTAVYQSLQVRLLSPDIQQSDLVVTLKLDQVAP